MKQLKTTSLRFCQKYRVTYTFGKKYQTIYTLPVQGIELPTPFGEQVPNYIHLIC